MWRKKTYNSFETVTRLSIPKHGEPATNELEITFLVNNKLGRIDLSVEEKDTEHFPAVLEALEIEKQFMQKKLYSCPPLIRWPNQHYSFDYVQ